MWRVGQSVLGSVLVAGALVAQGEWKLRASSDRPASRCEMVFDSGRQVLVLVDHNLGGGFAETWEWNGTDWELRATDGPASRTEAGLAFDAKRSKTVLFGGRLGGATTVQDTWEWDGLSWSSRAPTIPPGKRSGVGMVYDEARGRVVLFGGFNTTAGVNAETWEWDGSTWSMLDPAASPPARHRHAIAYDSARQRVVLFGGTNTDASFAFGDTWEWDGSDWLERHPQVSPPARWGHQLAFDAKAGRTILFGGQDSESFGYLYDTWSWDGSEWQLLQPLASPAARAEHAMAYDSRRDVVVLFGGTNGNELRDTWEYVRGVPGTFSTFGQGCPGSRGTPFLTLRSSPPVAGKPFAVQVNRLPLAGAAFLFLGASKTDYLGLPLPFDLGVIGMDGCLLYTSADRVDNLKNVLGVALWTLQIPRSLANRTFYLQSIVSDPFANLLGMTVSNAGEAFVGW